MSQLPRQRDGQLPGPRSRPVRVSFVIDNLSRAGTEMQLLALLRELDQSLVEPSLVLLDGWNASSRALEPTHLPVLRLGLRKLLSPQALAATSRLRAFWRRYPPDIVQAYFLDSAYFALPLAALEGVRYRLRVRNNLGYWQTRRHRVLERLVRPLVTATLTNCVSARQVMVHRDGMPADRVFVLENGVDLDRFPATANHDHPLAETIHPSAKHIDSTAEPIHATAGPTHPTAEPIHATIKPNHFEEPSPPSPGFNDASVGAKHAAAGLKFSAAEMINPKAGLIVSCVANLRPVKNIDGLMRAARCVLDHLPHARFRVAGEGPERRRLESLKMDLRLSEAFELCGPIMDVPAFLLNANLVVLPSHSEGMSNALLEAMAAGRAIVATDVGENRATLGSAGVLVPPGDDAALANAMIHLLNDPLQRAALGRAARQRVEERFSRAAMRQRFEQFYLSLMDNRAA